MIRTPSPISNLKSQIPLLLLLLALTAHAAEPWSDPQLPLHNGLILWLDPSRQNLARQSRHAPPLPNPPPPNPATPPSFQTTPNSTSASTPPAAPSISPNPSPPSAQNSASKAPTPPSSSMAKTISPPPPSAPPSPTPPSSSTPPPSPTPAASAPSLP